MHTTLTKRRGSRRPKAWVASWGGTRGGGEEVTSACSFRLLLLCTDFHFSQSLHWIYITRYIHMRIIYSVVKCIQSVKYDGVAAFLLEEEL